MFEDFQAVTDRELAPLMGGYTFQAELRELSVEGLAELFAILQFLEKRVKDRKQAVRALLLETLKRQGAPTPKGGQVFNTVFGLATRERRQDHLPDEDALKLLLAKKRMPISSAFSKVQRLVFDPSKLEELIKSGKLVKEEVEDLKPVNHALKFKPNPQTEAVLAESGTEES